MSPKKIRIGSRGSELALRQTGTVLDKLQQSSPGFEFEIVVIKTEGDKSSLASLREKALAEPGVFTKEIEDALESGKVDIAVHSAKDLPTQMRKGLAIGAVLKRETVFDAWISREDVTLDTIRKGAVVGTSSPRRRAQLLRRRPDLKIIEMRGNVPTRIEKMKAGEADAVVLAACGLERLGLMHECHNILDPAIVLPAVSQGALAVEVRANDPETAKIVAPLNDRISWSAIVAERALLAVLQGGCQVPVGVYTDMKSGLSMKAALYSPDGDEVVEDEISGGIEDAEKLGRSLGEKMKSRGEGILRRIRGAHPAQIPEH